jgi:prepilin-type N-terminal cleavage/methylation domain-containing protein
MKKMRDLEAGFTLVEILVVLIILGIVAGISILAFGNSRKNSIQSACKTNFQSSLLAVQAFQSDNDGALPDSLISLAPTYINSGLIETDNFSLQLQKLNGGFNILVASTQNATVRAATLVSASNPSYTYFVADTSALSIGQKVSGTGISSLISTMGGFSSGANFVTVDSSDGITAGMSVIGEGIANGATVVSVDTNLDKVTLSSPTTTSSNSTGLVFGALPTVSSIDPANGNVTISGDGAFMAPVLNSKYTLVFGGSLISGTAPTACRSL